VGAEKTVGRQSRAERAAVLRKVSEGLLARKQELSLLLVGEVGKTIREAQTEVERASATFLAAAEEAKRIAGEVIPFDAVPAGAGRRGFAFKVPIGTVVAITPFNFPLNLAAHKVAPAIAAGNCVVLKPASQTPLTGLALGKAILDAGFPPAGLSVLPGPGGTLGAALVGDPRPRMVTFTGSAEVGRRIAASAGLKRLAMELGSNSAVIVTASADLEAAAARIVTGAFALAGQVCISVQRVLAHRKIYGDLTGRIIGLASRLRVGDPLEAGTDMGPMISPEAARGLKAWIDQAAEQGAEVRLGGDHRGTLFSPTVLTAVPTAAEVWKEEAFGPVVCINPYDGLEEAVEAVNRSKYGLQAGIFTASLDEAFQAVYDLEVGGVMVNDVPTYRVDHMPYGGVKDSGLGREGLKYAIDEMSETKLVCFNFWRP
jgi:glyceraldehyde-3-phosphate dehydrogenase (NADP+)